MYWLCFFYFFIRVNNMLTNVKKKFVSIFLITYLAVFILHSINLENIKKTNSIIWLIFFLSYQSQRVGSCILWCLWFVDIFILTVVYLCYHYIFFIICSIKLFCLIIILALLIFFTERFNTGFHKLPLYSVSKDFRAESVFAHNCFFF